MILAAATVVLEYLLVQLWQWLWLINDGKIFLSSISLSWDYPLTTTLFCFHRETGNRVSRSYFSYMLLLLLHYCLSFHIHLHLHLLSYKQYHWIITVVMVIVTFTSPNSPTSKISFKRASSRPNRMSKMRKEWTDVDTSVLRPFPKVMWCFDKGIGTAEAWLVSFESITVTDRGKPQTPFEKHRSQAYTKSICLLIRHLDPEKSVP